MRTSNQRAYRAYRMKQLDEARDSAARALRCPKCRAMPGKDCWGSWAAVTVVFLHRERYDAADRARAAGDAA